MKIGISFSGGGARAIAHMGVIKAFNENGIYADEVSGTSGGSIVAALYAAGISVDDMIDVAREASILKIVKAGIPIKGFTDLKYLKQILDKLLNHDSFEKLNIPLTVVATNLNTGAKEMISKGSLKKAVMASCTIPILFQPIEIDGKILVDGGILDNMPIESLQKKCDFIIGINVMPNIHAVEEDVDNMLNIGMRVFDIAISSNTQMNIPQCDYIIEPTEIINYSIFDFAAHKALFKLGYDSAIKEVPKILSLISSC